MLKRRSLTGARRVMVRLRRIGGLAVAVLAVFAALPPQPARGATGWLWPLGRPHQVVHGFAPPAQDWLPGNRGVDLAGRIGERVVAAGSGVVSFAGPIAGIGVVSVTTGTLRTTYEPLRVTVHRGQPVRAGQSLGTLTAAGSHCPPRVCLHWGLLRGSTYLDPLALLGLGIVRLLPLGSPNGSPALPTGAAAGGLAVVGAAIAARRRRRPSG